jgi:hypothetical protein
MRDLFAKVMTGSMVAGAALLVAACGGGGDTNTANTANYSDEALMGNDVTTVDAMNGTDANLGTGADMNAATDMNATTTTNSTGNYSITGLVNGTYTVTPSRSGYTFTPPSQSVTISNANQTGVNFTAAVSTATARAVSINFVGSGTAMGTSESAGVVAKTNWNNAANNVSSAPLALKDETGASNGATVTWTSDNNWAVPITDTAGNFRMIRGYLDTGNQNPTTVNIAGLPASSTGYDVYVYTDGDNETFTFTGTYQISGAGINTPSVQATDPGNTNFNGTFTLNRNYVKFSSIQATAFVIKATPTSSSTTYLRAPLNGIQIVPR